MSDPTAATPTLTPIRLAIVVSHPIQHFVPFYRRLAAAPELCLRVLFMSNFSTKKFFDEEMGAEIGWDMDMTSGYPHRFLDEADTIKRPSPLSLNNPSVTRELDDFRPDVVLSYGYNQITQMRVLAWRRKSRTPVMMISDSELQQQRASWKQKLRQILLPRLLRSYASFLTTGDNNEAYLLAYGVPREKLFRSPFTIDEDAYLDARARRADLRRSFRAAHGIGENEIVVLSVGKLSPRKRPLDVVAVAERLQADPAAKAPIRFVLAGDGAEKAAIEARVAARSLPVTTLGFVGLDRLPQTYAAADILLHPAEADPHPLVMSEAACIGLPVIVSDRVGAIGPTDILRPDQNAIVTPCGDVGAIARAVLRLAGEEALRAQMSAASLRIFSELDARRSVAGAIDAARHAVARGRAGVSSQPVGAAPGTT